MVNEKVEIVIIIIIFGGIFFFCISICHLLYISYCRSICYCNSCCNARPNSSTSNSISTPNVLYIPSHSIVSNDHSSTENKLDDNNDNKNASNTENNKKSSRIHFLPREQHNQMENGQWTRWKNVTLMYCGSTSVDKFQYSNRDPLLIKNASEFWLEIKDLSKIWMIVINN